MDCELAQPGVLEEWGGKWSFETPPQKGEVRRKTVL